MLETPAGIILDLVFGDPRNWPHPIRLIGRAVDIGFKAVSKPKLGRWGQRLAGGLLWLAVVGATWLCTWALLRLAGAIWEPLAWLVGAVLVWNCLALKDLIGHIKPIIIALRSQDMPLAREKLSWVVGRQTAELDETGVTRAALETLAENLADGLTAPLFYILIGGPALGLAYKAVNTLDSMIGYKHAPYTHLGLVSARLDDVINWIPARLTAGFIILAAFFLRADGPAAWRTSLGEHRNSASPNAGWPEAALAGALGVSLLGPAIYAGQRSNKPYINLVGRAPELVDLEKGLKLIWVSGLIAYGLAIIISI